MRAVPLNILARLLMLLPNPPLTTDVVTLMKGDNVVGEGVSDFCRSGPDADRDGRSCPTTCWPHGHSRLEQKRSVILSNLCCEVSLSPWLTGLAHFRSVRWSNSLKQLSGIALQHL